MIWGFFFIFAKIAPPIVGTRWSKLQGGDTMAKAQKLEIRLLNNKGLAVWQIAKAVGVTEAQVVKVLGQ